MGAELRDIGEFMGAEVITIDNDATAAGTGDATEVTGAEIDMEQYESGYIEIGYVTTLTADKTLSFETQQADCDTSGGSYTADAAVQAATVVATGAQTGLEGIHKIDLPSETLKALKRYVKFKITPDLSHTGTDTCTWSATFHGIKRVTS